MICMARRLGAPVTDPPGKVAASNAARPISGRSCPRTVVIRWWTVGSDTKRASEATSTLPARQTRPRSLRSRVHDHDVLGAVLGGSGGSAAAARSVAASAPRGRVPLMGAVSTTPSAREREKPLGRVAEDGDAASLEPPAPGGDERGVRRRARRFAAPPRARRRAGRQGRQPPRQVHLIGIPGLR